MVSNTASRSSSDDIDPRLQRVIDAYGGLAAWLRIETVRLRLHHLHGPLPAAKGLGRTFAAPQTVTIVPQHWRVEFHDFPVAGAEAVFERGRVRLRAPSKALVLDESNFRRRFRGLAKYRRWSNAEAAYFFGYALATYVSVPFLLPAYATDIREAGGGLRVRARFPGDIDTHSSVQSFWFNQGGLLVRHDYRADIVGWWAAGAHLSSDYQIVNGLPIATRRRIVARMGRWQTPLPVLSADIEPIDVTMIGE
jgi:hypothetical protein